MKLIVEEAHYRTNLYDLLPAIQNLDDGEDSGGKWYKSTNVGYCYLDGDCVFFVPKVVMDETRKIFGRYAPDDILNFTEFCEKHRNEPGYSALEDDYGFLYEFSTWVYRSLCVYDDTNKDNKIVKKHNSAILGNTDQEAHNSYLDIMLSLVRFAEEHKDYFVFETQERHRGMDNISWGRTIATSQALVQDGVPVYLNPVNRHNEIDFDEELMVIFFSILNYLNHQHGQPVDIPPYYELIDDEDFEDYVKSDYGMMRLEQIRYKYFSDIQLEIWNLCYTFFERAQSINAESKEVECMLASDYDNVFEAMIDYLISDEELNGSVLKSQPDKKKVDHIYSHEGLVSNQQIYYIGDSKYYQQGNVLDDYSIFKQYTYARNVIQLNISALLGDLSKKKDPIAKRYKTYRDAETEGYNITPNFFVRGKVYENHDYSDKDISYSGDEKPQMHFKNRLFDRDTLLLQYYDVNFLFILTVYARDDRFEQLSFREKVRKLFREKIVKYLDDNFSFYQILVDEDDISDFVEHYFRKIEGKVFSFEHVDRGRILLYAECKNQKNACSDSDTVDENRDAHVFGDVLIIPSRGKRYLYKVRPIALGKDDYQRVELPVDDYALVGYCKDADHLAWIEQNDIYNLRYRQRGKVLKVNDYLLYASYLILHSEDGPNRLFRIAGEAPCLVKKEDLPQGEYKPSSSDEYLVYGLSDVRESDSLIRHLVESSSFNSAKAGRKAPFTINMKKLHQLLEEKHAESRDLSIDEDELQECVAEDVMQYDTAPHGAHPTE